MADTPSPKAAQGGGARHREAVISLVRLLHAYEEAEPGSRDAQAAYLALRTQFPNLDFNARLEPRLVVVRQFRATCHFDVETFASTVEAIVQRDDLTSPELCLLCALLGAADAIILPATAFELAARLAPLAGDPTADEALAALPQALGRQPVTILSLLERASDPPMPLVHSGLQTTASYAPAMLGTAMTILAPSISSLRCNADALSVIMRDVVRRAGDHTVLLALAGQARSVPVNLLRAAFAAPDAPFKIRAMPFEHEELQTWYVAGISGRLVLTDEGLGRPVQEWLAQVYRAINARGSSADVSLARSGQEQGENWGEGAGLWAPQLQVQLVANDREDNEELNPLVNETSEFFAQIAG